MIRGFARPAAAEANVETSVTGVTGSVFTETDGADPYTDDFNLVSGFLKSFLTPSTEVVDVDLEDAILEDED